MIGRSLVEDSLEALDEAFNLLSIWKICRHWQVFEIWHGTFPVTVNCDTEYIHAMHALLNAAHHRGLEEA